MNGFTVRLPDYERLRPSVEHMRVDHRCLDVAMAQDFPDRLNIVPSFEQVSGKGMPEGAASGSLREACFRDRVSDGLLNQ